MSDTLTAIDTAAEALKTVILGLDLTLTDSMSAYWPAIRDLDSVPCGIIELPDIRRVSIDEEEVQLGARDINLTFPVAFLADLSESDYSQRQLLEIVAQFVEEIDADPSLGGVADEARVTESEVNFAQISDGARSLLVYDSTVEVRLLLPDLDF